MSVEVVRGPRRGSLPCSPSADLLLRRTWFDCPILRVPGKCIICQKLTRDLRHGGELHALQQRPVSSDACAGHSALTPRVNSSASRREGRSQSSRPFEPLASRTRRPGSRSRPEQTGAGRTAIVSAKNLVSYSYTTVGCLRDAYRHKLYLIDSVPRRRPKPAGSAGALEPRRR